MERVFHCVVRRSMDNASIECIVMVGSWGARCMTAAILRAMERTYA